MTDEQELPSVARRGSSTKARPSSMKLRQVELLWKLPWVKWEHLMLLFSWLKAPRLKLQESSLRTQSWL